MKKQTFLFKDIFDIRKGRKEKESLGRELRYIQIGDLRNDDNIKYCEKNDKNILIDENDLVIAWDGANAGIVGFGLSGAIGSTLGRLRLKENFDSSIINTHYIGYYLILKERYLKENATGATIPHVSRKSLENLKIKLPTLDVQDRIVAILKKVNAVKVLRQQQIETLSSLKKSVFLDMFGDIKKNPNNYELRSLTEFYIDEKTSLKCGPFGSALKKSEYTNEGVPVWNMDNISRNNEFSDSVNLWITPDKFIELESYNAKDGDVIISRAGTVGKMAVVRTEFDKSIISTNLIRLRFTNELLPEFFVMMLRIFGDRVSKLRTGNEGSFTHMNTKVLNSVVFPYPPINYQKKYVNILNQINSREKELINSQSIIQNLYDSLLYKSFNSELFKEKTHK